MRLIDADKLEKEMNELCCGECEVCGLSNCPAYSQPTAYDVDKVIKEIKELSIREFGEIKTDDVIKIVKAGDIDG